MAAAAAGWLKRPIALGLAMLALGAIVAAALVALIRHAAPPDVRTAFPAGEIVVGVDGSFPPFALDDGETLQGLDIDLARAIARDIDLPARFLNIGYYALHDALISGRVDLLISALRVDPARMDDLRYTASYFDNGFVLITDADDSHANFDALKDARIAYEYASGAESLIRDWEADGRQLMRRPYELPQYALDALRLEQADAAIVDATTFRLYQSAHMDWSAKSEFISHDPYAIALRIDRVDAWKLVDSALAALKESGELAKIIDRWL